MKMSMKILGLDSIFPLMAVKDGIILSKTGDLTMGWQVQLPAAFELQEDGYDQIIIRLSSALRRLPPCCIVHKQDVYSYNDYQPQIQDSDGYLRQSYENHFGGRPYLTHKCYIYLTCTRKAELSRSCSSSGFFVASSQPRTPSRAEAEKFLSVAQEFSDVFTGGGSVSLRGLTDDDLLGTVEHPGLIQKIMMLGSSDLVLSDIEVSPSYLSSVDRMAGVFSVGEASCLPSQMSSVTAVQNLGTPKFPVVMSFASKLGILLDCEHIVNQYFVTSEQREVTESIESRKKKMNSLSSQNDNRINYEDLSKAMEQFYRDDTLLVHSHLNVFVICKGNEEALNALLSKISSAISGMGMTASRETAVVPILWYSSLPGAESEIGKDNLMLMELMSSLMLTSLETFEEGLKGGTWVVSDRLRHIPIHLDFQRLALEKGIIDNHNIFLLGPSGTGKSFTTNSIVRNAYDSGAHIFIVDRGDSYEGLCQLIQEESGGVDGTYLTWNYEHPFSFNPFIGYKDWFDEAECVKADCNGFNFILSFLQTAFDPPNGWSADLSNILSGMVEDFLRAYRKKDLEELPIFDDLLNYFRESSEKIADNVGIGETENIIKEIPTARRSVDGAEYEMFLRGKRHLYNSNKEEIGCEEYGYWLGSERVTEAIFPATRFILSLQPYESKGKYGFLLNAKKPKDIAASRFVIFEVGALADVQDKKFYSLCVLCIVNSFDSKIKTEKAFKMLVVDEAWQAIANETMAPYLKGLWKTARKFYASAMVVTQELNDILSSPVIQDAILNNSSVKIFLDQSSNLSQLEKVDEIMQLNSRDDALIRSINKTDNPKNYRYREFFVTMGGKFSGVFCIEASPQEALAYESNKSKKAPILARANELGSLQEAITEACNKK